MSLPRIFSCFSVVLMLAETLTALSAAQSAVTEAWMNRAGEAAHHVAILAVVATLLPLRNRCPTDNDFEGNKRGRRQCGEKYMFETKCAEGRERGLPLGRLWVP